MEGAETKLEAGKAIEIKQAAYDSIIENGFCEITTQMIAKKAGVSKSMIHYYFKDKNELVAEVAKHAVDQLIETIREVLAKYSTREEKIDRGITDLWEAFKGEQGIWITMFENAINGRRIPAIREKLVYFYRELLKQITAEIFPGEDIAGRTSAKDAEAMVSIFSGTIESFIFHYLVDPEATDFEYSLEMLQRIARLLLQLTPGLDTESELRS